MRAFAFKSELQGLLRLLRAAAVKQLEAGGAVASPFGFQPSSLPARSVPVDEA
jgi:hypothetical protein